MTRKRLDDVTPAVFASLDLRVGVIVDAQPFPEARKPALKVYLDFGPLIGVLATSAQITSYLPESLIGMQVVAAINLGNRQIGPFMSRCLLLAATADDGSVTLLVPASPVEPGTSIA